MGKIWLRCLHNSASIACGPNEKPRHYEVVNHMVEVDERDARDLVNQEGRQSRFGGRYVVPTEIYWGASQAEIDAHISNTPELAERHRQMEIEQARLRREELARRREELAAEEARIAALLAEEEGALVAVGEKKGRAGK